MKKDERSTEESIPAIEVRLDKGLLELAREFELELIEGEKMISSYEKEELSYEDLFDHLKKLQNISRAIQGGLTLRINRYYGKTKNAKIVRSLKKLGYGNDSS